MIKVEMMMICSMRDVKRIHGRLIRSLVRIPTSTAAFILAKLLRFAAVSPSGDLLFARRLLSFHRSLCHAAPNPTFFYNTLMRGHAARFSSPALAAVSILRSMRLQSIPPDHFSFTFLIKATSSSTAHALAIKFGCLDLHVYNALIHLYASAADTAAARRVFDEIPYPDVVSWSGILTAYLRERDTDAARRVFDVMPERDVVAWTAMIAGYSQAGRPTDAIRLFRSMPLPPDEVTLVGVVSACASAGDLEAGEAVYRYTEEKGLGWMVSLRNALLDMYAKCGCVGRARQVFDATHAKSLVTWNSMISAYAAHGDADAAIDLFAALTAAGVNPDGTTYLAVLAACAHCGSRVQEGRRVWEQMRTKNGVNAGVEHYGCMVDMLGRAGLLDEAYCLIKDMPMPANDIVWGALLNACRIHGDTTMAEHAVGKLMELKPQEGGYSVLLSQLYAASGRMGEAAHVWTVMKQQGVRKNTGCATSWPQESGHYQFQSFNCYKSTAD